MVLHLKKLKQPVDGKYAQRNQAQEKDFGNQQEPEAHKN